MFDALPDQWLPAVFSSKLTDKPLEVTVAGVSLALFRDKSGAPGALVDRCPHRGVKLSLGEVKDGCLTCPFHGWAFRGDGSCEHVPLNPSAKRELLSASSVPAVERGGIVWIYTRIGVDAPPMGEIHEGLEDKSASRRELEETWSAHWTRAMENMLDIPHLPFVHRKTIGGDLAKRDLRSIGIEYDLEDTQSGFRLSWKIGGEPDSGDLEWRKPAGMVLNIYSPVGLLQQHVFCVPAAENTTRMMLVSVAKKPWWAKLIPAAAFEGFEDRILLEDRSIVESSPPGSVLDATSERSVASDKPTLKFRAWLRAQRAGGREEAA